jgi:hypothetical protein
MKIGKTLLQSTLLVSAVNIYEVQASWETVFIYGRYEYMMGFTYVENQECGQILLIANELMRDPNTSYESPQFEWGYWKSTRLARVHEVVLDAVRNNLDTYPEGDVYYTIFGPDGKSACSAMSVYAYQRKIDWAEEVNDNIWKTLIEEKIVKSRN